MADAGVNTHNLLVVRSGSPEMITMSGAASVRPDGAGRSAASDRRLSVRTRWTMTKVRLFPQP